MGNDARWFGGEPLIGTLFLQQCIAAKQSPVGGVYPAVRPGLCPGYICNSNDTLLRVEARARGTGEAGRHDSAGAGIEAYGADWTMAGVFSFTYKT